MLYPCRHVRHGAETHQRGNGIKIIDKFKRKIEIVLVAAFISATPLGMPQAVAEPRLTLKTPPLERYTCYQVYAPSLTYTYMGYFILQAGKQYAWGVGKGKTTKRGRYSFDAQGIRFVDGPLKGVTGRFETKKNGRHLLELTIQGEKQSAGDDGKITWYCNCDPHDPYKKNTGTKRELQVGGVA
jgi:hypothetical protein